MSKPDLMSLAELERAALLALLRDLSDQQWQSPSLCPGWTVRDVTVHVVRHDELFKAALARTMVAGGPSPTRANDVALRRYAELGPEQVIDLVARCQTPRGLTAGLGGGIAVTDGTIHHKTSAAHWSCLGRFPRTSSPRSSTSH